MALKHKLTPLEQQINQFRFVGWVFLSFPVVVAFLAFFAQTTRGILIGLLSLLPMILFVPISLKLRDRSQFRPSMPAGLVLATVVLTGLAFVLMPMAYLSPSNPPFWRLLFLQATLIGAGLMSGLIKHDARALQENQCARHKVQPGSVLIRKRPSGIYGFREKSGSFLFDWGARVIYGVYAVLTVIGAFVGGAAPTILLRFIGPQPSLGLDAHAAGVSLLGMLALPFVGYILPALYRSWVGLRRIERAAAHPGMQVVYSWEA